MGVRHVTFTGLCFDTGRRKGAAEGTCNPLAFLSCRNYRMGPSKIIAKAKWKF